MDNGIMDNVSWLNYFLLRNSLLTEALSIMPLSINYFSSWE